MASLFERRKIESTLHLLIELLIDSQEGLVTVGERLKDLALRRYFLAESLERGQFIEELLELCDQLEFGPFRDSGSAAGILHRTWARLKFKISESDFVLLVTAEHGERAITKLYELALRRRPPYRIRKVLIRQARHVWMTHRFVRLARDRALIRPAQSKAQEIPQITENLYGIGEP